MNDFWETVKDDLGDDTLRISKLRRIHAKLGIIELIGNGVLKLVTDLKRLETESICLGKPLQDTTLYMALHRCTIGHPSYKRTVETHQSISFKELARALTARQRDLDMYL